MEPLETPIKDGILYQQQVKFGKVGTLAARQLPRTGGGLPPLPTGTWEGGGGSQAPGAKPGVGEWDRARSCPQPSVGLRECF